MIAYLRVSTDRQGESGAGLAAQRATIEAAHRVEHWFQDVESGSGKRKLPGRDQALELAAETGLPLVCAKLDRLTRSAVDFYEINEHARKHGYALKILDVQMDTSTAMGEAMAGIAAVFAQLERRRISDRTKEALQQKREQGVRLGRPRSIPEHVRSLAVDMLEDGIRPAHVARCMTLDRQPVSVDTVYRWDRERRKALA